MTWEMKLQEARRDSFTEGRQREILSSVREGDYSAERGAEKLGISVEEFKKLLQER